MTRHDWAVEVRHVAKPWGHEEHFAFVDGRYCGKVLVINAGHALSLQFHRHKDETVSVATGRVTLEIGRCVQTLERFDIGPGESVRIPAGTIHRMTAAVDSTVLEASTTELDDVVRIDDRYGRHLSGTVNDVAQPRCAEHGGETRRQHETARAPSRSRLARH